MATPPLGFPSHVDYFYSLFVFIALTNAIKVLSKVLKSTADINGRTQRH